MAHHDWAEKHKEDDEDHKPSENGGESARLHVECLLAIKVEAGLIGEGRGSNIQNLLVPWEIELNLPVYLLEGLISRF